MGARRRSVRRTEAQPRARNRPSFFFIRSSSIDAEGVTPPAVDFGILTEGSDFLMTEANDNLVTEAA